MKKREVVFLEPQIVEDLENLKWILRRSKLSLLKEFVEDGLLKYKKSLDKRKEL